MPTNRELELERMKMLDRMNEKLDVILTLLKSVPVKEKKIARKTSKNS
tara:strand:- start:820 stop:963 length:144 start_codon:yes stop_codon:yes gene_type:complete